MLDTVANATSLSDNTRARASAVLKALFAAEARVHGANPDDIHLHELGTADTLVDVVGVAHGLEQLGVQRIYASPLVLGEATGPRRPNGYSNPAPATLEIIAAAKAPVAPERPFHANVGELTTPTGAALITTLADEFRQPAMTLHRIGVGAGGKNPPAFPNVLRLWLGETIPSVPIPTPAASQPYISTTIQPTRRELTPLDNLRSRSRPAATGHTDVPADRHPSAHSDPETHQPAHGEPVEPRADGNHPHQPSKPSAPPPWKPTATKPRTSHQIRQTPTSHSPAGRTTSFSSKPTSTTPPASSSASPWTNSSPPAPSTSGTPPSR